MAAHPFCRLARYPLLRDHRRAVLPKIELHLHLDCSLSFDVVRELRPSVSEQQFRQEFIAPRRCTNLVDFLSRVPPSLALMQTEAGLRAVTRDVFRQLQSDNVIYAEIRFAPLLHTEQNLSPEIIVEIVNDSVTKAIRDTGVEARLILCTLRHFSAEQSMQTARLVERFRETNVVALDLAGSEAGFPIDAHIHAYEFAQQKNLYRTAHAGEACGPESVWETLKALKPTRIGHGVRSIEDPALIDHLREHRIHLEVCPSSNLQTNMYPELSDHPLDRLYRGGISLGINTDARTITDVTLEQEYEMARSAFGWTDVHFLNCNLNALQAAFIPDQLKAQLSARLRSNK
jgi:adenosine deaminase